MTCAACAVRVERALNRVPGAHATVNLAAERARVELTRVESTDDAAREALVGAIERAGYGARVIVERDDAGWRFYRGAFNALRGGGANMDVLVALGTSIAYGFSAYVTLTDRRDLHVYFEVAAVVITLVLLGKLLETRAKSRTSAAVRALLALQPTTAHVERNGITKKCRSLRSSAMTCW